MRFLSSLNERRKEPRFSYSTLVHYHIKERENIWNYAHSVDISTHGIRLVINRRVEPNDPLILKMTLPGLDESLELRGTTVWRKSLGGRIGLECGIAFDEIACAGDLERLRIFLAMKFTAGPQFVHA